MMRRILALGLAALLLLGACVLAEAPAAASIEEELTGMIPVLDALAEAMNAANEDPAFHVAYDADDAEFTREVLWRLGAEWGGVLKPEDVAVTAFSVSVPDPVMCRPLPHSFDRQSI